MANVVGITIRVDDADAEKIQRLQHQLDRLKSSATQGVGASGFAGVSEGARRGAEGLLQFEGSARSLREAIHVLHPVLEQAGLGLSNFAGLGFALRAGLPAFAAALTGTLLVALEKVAEGAAKAKAQLNGLLPGAAGEQLFK